MSSPRFELAKREHPELVGLLDQLMSYIRRQSGRGQDFILPKLAGAELGISDGEAYVILEILVRTGVLERAFNVYCKSNDILLATVSTEDELDQVPYCDYCDRDHEPQDLRLELAFRLNEEANGTREAA
jgi:hypothetical protein